jgi:hypothetical protein
MKKKLLIILYPFNIRTFDIERYEVAQLSKYFDIQIHNFHKILYPNFRNSHKKNLIFKKNIISFYSYNLWKKYFLDLIRIRKKKIFVINFLTKDKFIAMKILLFLKKNNIIRIDMLNPGLPQYSFEDKIFSAYEHFFYKIKNFLLRPRYVYENTKIIVKKFFFKYLEFFFNSEPDFIITAGKKYFDILKRSKTKKVKIINGNTNDYSRFLKKKKIKVNLENKNYGVFLSNPGPIFPNDDLFWKTKMTDSVHKYYSSLNNFLKDIEAINKTKILIALHPKSKNEKNLKYLGSRRAYYNKTLELVKNSKFVITFASTSLSYALLFKKPIFFIYTNSIKNKDPGGIKYQNFLHRLIGGKFIYINDYSLDELELNQNRISIKKYNNYIKNYIKFGNNNKKNFEIINRLV